MSLDLRTLAAVLLLVPAATATGVEIGPDLPVEPGDTVRDTAGLGASGQHLVSIVEEPGATTGALYRFEATTDGWRRIGPAAPVVVGRSGVGPKREGDGRSPRGVFALGPAFGYAPTPPDGLRLAYRAMEPGTVCVDDPDSDHYAQIVDPARTENPDWSSAEAMRRDRVHGDDLYEWGIEVAFNPEGRPGAGSCIFLHVWRGPESPTVGCTAMPEETLLELMTWLRPAESPVLIQGTRAYLERLHAEGVLPYPIPEPE